MTSYRDILTARPPVLLRRTPDSNDSAPLFHLGDGSSMIGEPAVSGNQRFLAADPISDPNNGYRKLEIV
jgi:hypothetical protein